jgi:hypothetical protein
MKVRMAIRSGVHHATKIVETTHMSYTFIYIIAVIVNPLNHNISRALMPPCTSPAITSIPAEIKCSTGNLGSERGLERGLRLGV